MQVFDGHKFEKLTVEKVVNVLKENSILLFSFSKIFAYWYFLKLQ
jgi:hypothetical protein